MSKHTPGPWALMHGMPTNVLGAGGIRVARCDFDGDFSHPECKANARLIAAAPDLLQEIEKQVAWLLHVRAELDGVVRESILLGIDQSIKHLSSAIAIAKAEGRS